MTKHEKADSIIVRADPPIADIWESIRLAEEAQWAKLMAAMDSGTPMVCHIPKVGGKAEAKLPHDEDLSAYDIMHEFWGKP